MEGVLAGTLNVRFDLFTQEEQVWAEGSAAVEAPFLLGALAGVGAREIQVSKKMTYQGLYR